LINLELPVILALGVDVSLIVVDRKLFICMVKNEDPFALCVVREGVQLHGSLMDEYGGGAFGKVFGGNWVVFVSMEIRLHDMLQ